MLYIAFLKGNETVQIRSKNNPDYRFGLRDESQTELYITNENVLSFYEIHPGLQPDNIHSASFQSVKDGKYIINQNSLLELKTVEESEDFKKAATFEIVPDKFISVSIPQLQTISILTLQPFIAKNRMSYDMFNIFNVYI